jgi:hypothetical protein
MIEHLSHNFRLPILGRIRLGIMVPNAAGVMHPKDLDYFVMPPELVERDPEHFAKPKSLDVMFHSDNIDHVFDTRYEVYAGRRGGAGGLLTMYCDGLNYTQIPKNVNEKKVQGKCRRPLPEAGKPWPTCECGAEPKGRLLVCLLHGQVGVYLLTMGGHRQIQQLLEDIRMRHGEFGRLRGIPFRLLRRPETTSVPDRDGNRIPKMGHPVRLDSRFTLYQALTSRGVDPYQLAEQVQRSLPGPIDDEPVLDLEDDEDGAEERRDVREEPRADGAEIERRVEESSTEGDRGLVAEVEDAEVEEDEPMAFALADALGVSEEDYRVYTRAKYRVVPLEPEHIAQECTMFRAATTDEEKADLLRRISVKVASLRAAAKHND